MQDSFKRAFNYGETLFVTILGLPKKKMLWPSLHWSKLAQEMSCFTSNWNEKLEKEKFQCLIDQFIPENSYSRLRLNYFIANRDMPLMISKKQKTQIIWEKELQVTNWELDLENIFIKTAQPMLRLIDERLKFECKVGSYGYESLYCLKKGETFNDIIWVNPDQTIQECTTANVFCILSPDHWCTPKMDRCYPGTTREMLIKWLPTQGIKVSESNFSLKDVNETDGLVFTNATNLMGILHITNGVKMKKEILDQVQLLRKKFFLDMLNQASGQL